MGLSNFPSASEGVLPILVTNTVISMAILKNLLKPILQLMGGENWVTDHLDENSQTSNEMLLYQTPNSPSRRNIREVSVTQFKKLCEKERESCNLKGMRTISECCVCLCKFREDEEVSELSCKHFFHRNCLDKWFDNHHCTCPVCRSIH